MPLNKQNLKTSIKELLDESKDNDNQEDSIENYATKLADIIDEYVRTGLVSVTGTTASGVAVSATGSIT